MSYYSDQLDKISSADCSIKIKDVDGRETKCLNLNSDSATDIVDFCYSSEGFETGAPNRECNDFVLTALNDYDCYQLLIGGFTAKTLYLNNSYLNQLDIDLLDFTWLNRYLKASVAAD